MHTHLYSVHLTSTAAPSLPFHDALKGPWPRHPPLHPSSLPQPPDQSLHPPCGRNSVSCQQSDALHVRRSERKESVQRDSSRFFRAIDKHKTQESVTLRRDAEGSRRSSPRTSEWHNAHGVGARTMQLEEKGRSHLVT